MPPNPSQNGVCLKHKWNLLFLGPKHFMGSPRSSEETRTLQNCMIKTLFFSSLLHIFPLFPLSITFQPYWKMGFQTEEMGFYLWAFEPVSLSLGNVLPSFTYLAKSSHFLGLSPRSATLWTVSYLPRTHRVTVSIALYVLVWCCSHSISCELTWITH